jgi:outer membrane protein OmpA-like peptidoglycan-associated protein
MKILNTLIAVTIVSALGWTQSYKADYAKKLSKELQFADALPVWEELSNAFINKKKKSKAVVGDYSFLRETAYAAMASENYEKALHWNQVLVNKKQANAQDWVNLLELICLNKKYSRLTNAVDSATSAFPMSDLVTSWKVNLPKINAAVNSTSEYTVSLYKKANKGEDFAAFPYKKGILFASNEHGHGFVNREYERTNQNFTDLSFFDPNASKEKAKFYQKPFWIDVFFKNQWRDIKRTKSHDGPISFNPDYTMAFITSNHEEIDVIDRIKYARLKIRMFKLEGTEWNEVDFPFNSSRFSNGHATMDSLGNVFFVSNRPGSMVKNLIYADEKQLKVIDTVYSADIYKTTYLDGQWSAPINLGSSVNTAKDELFPFISSTNVLYFSSNGWPGMGGLDVFSSEMGSDLPVNIGNPLNSNADDFAYNVNELSGKGFVSSNRVGWVDQIYAFTKPVFRAELVATLKTCKGAPLKNKSIQIVNLTKNKAVAIQTNGLGKTEEPFKLDKNNSYKIYFSGDAINNPDTILFTATVDGEFEVKLTSYFKKTVTKLIATNENGTPLENVMMNLYKHNGEVVKFITASNGAYSWKNEGTALIDSVKMNLINYTDASLVIPSSFNENCLDTASLPLVLETNKGDEFIRLDMVLYNFDKFSLRPEGKIELDKLVKYMMQHPELNVELASHTDSRAKVNYNKKLSENRSKSCVSYIVSKGIPKGRIKAVGYGESRLLNRCADGVRCSIEEHQANRRTELKLINSSSQELNNSKLEK